MVVRILKQETRSSLPAPWLAVLSRIRNQHCLAEALLRFGIPVAAIEFEENRGVRDGHIRLDKQNAEDLGGLIQFLNNLLVRNVLHARAAEHGLEILAVVFDARCIDLGDKSNFLVRVDLGANVA